MAERQIILNIQARTGDIQKRLKEVNAALVAQSEDLKRLNAAYKQGLISQEQYADELAKTKKQSADLRKEQRDLNKQLDLNKKATDAAEGSNEQLRAQLALLTREYNKLGREQRENTEEGRKLSKATRQLSDELKKNERAIGDNRREVGNYENALNGVRGSLIGGAGLIFGIASLGEAAQAAARVFIDFEQKIATLSAISGATGAELEMLEADARRLGETTQFTASQVAELQTNFARVGFDTSQILAATEATLNLAIATGEDLAAASEVASFTLGGYGLSAEETARVTDVMAASFNASALNLERFQEATKLVSPIAKTANVSIEATTAALGALADAGLAGSIAGTGFRNVLFELSDENSKLAQKVGFSVQSSDDFIKALAVLKEQGIGTTEALELIDRRAVPALLNLVGNADKVANLTEQFENAEGAAAKAAETVGNTLQGDLLRAQSALEGLAIRIGEALTPAIRAIVQGFTTFIGLLVEAPKFIKENKDVLALLAAGLIAFNAQQIAAAARTLATNAALKAQAIATNAAAVAQRVLNTVLRANPIGLVITALTTLAGAFIIAYRRSEEFRGIVQGTFSAVKQVVTNFAEGVANTLGGIGGILEGIFTLDTDKIKEGFERYKEGVKQQTIDIGRGAGEAYNSAYNAEIQAGQGDAQASGSATAEATTEGVKMSIPEAGAAGEELGAAINEGVSRGVKAGPMSGSIKQLEEEVRRLQDQIANTNPESPIFQALIDQLRVAQTALDNTKAKVDLLRAGLEAPIEGPDISGIIEGIGGEEAFEDEEAEFFAEQERQKQEEKNEEVKKAAEERNKILDQERADNIRREREQFNKEKDLELAKQDIAFQTAGAIGEAGDLALQFVQEDSRAAQAIQIAQAVANTYVAANQALASSPPPFNFILTGITIAAGLANVAKIAGVEFADGGLVPEFDSGGKVKPNMVNAKRSVSGDNVLAKLTPGEVVLNRGQQMAIGGPAALAAAKVPGFALGGLVGAGVETAPAREAAQATAQGNRLERQISQTPAPVVTVKDISRVSTRVRVKDNISSI